MVGANGSFEIQQLCKHPREARGERWPPQQCTVLNFAQFCIAVQITIGAVLIGANTELPKYSKMQTPKRGLNSAAHTVYTVHGAELK